MSLGKFFRDYHGMNGLKGLSTWDDAKALLKKYGFQVDGPAEYNADRFWALVSLYFGKWNETIKPENIESLGGKRGYGPTSVRKLYVYAWGNRDALPLDGKAFNDLKSHGLYANVSSIDKVRVDVETKLSGERSVSLIDFHEMLRFRGQTGGRGPNHLSESDYKVVKGWNAWRLLCSTERERITRDWRWIYEHLVKDKDIAKELWDFYEEIG
jgi:hypothetical protein